MSEMTKDEALEPLPTTPEMLLEKLQELDIKYEIYQHEPIFTVQEGEHLEKDIPGLHCRNLFLRDKKKKMFLVVAANETPVDLKVIPDHIGSGRLSFGSGDRLWQHLGIRQGSVNPFCIINDTERNVKVVLDKHMMEADLVNYHPMDNAQTVGITPADLLKFIEYTGHEPQILDLRAL